LREILPCLDWRDANLLARRASEWSGWFRKRIGSAANQSTQPMHRTTMLPIRYNSRQTVGPQDY
jgi:hypothetical protein